MEGSVGDVKYTARLGAVNVSVDWANATGNGANLTSEMIVESGALELAEAVALAAGVWCTPSESRTHNPARRCCGPAHADQETDSSHQSIAHPV